MHLVRGYRGRDEPDLIETNTFLCVQGEREMAVVRRIEGSAEETDAAVPGWCVNVVRFAHMADATGLLAGFGCVRLFREPFSALYQGAHRG